MKYERESGVLAWICRYVSVGFVGSVAVLVYLMFFTENNAMANYDQDRRNDSLRNEIKLEKDSMAYYMHMNRLLTTDRGTMEQIVREQFHMQRPNEDVYLTE